MKCDVVQRRLLSIENPAQVPADVRAHLAICGICRDWHYQLVVIERNVSLLPVPRSRAKARLLHRFLLEPANAGNGPELAAASSPAALYPSRRVALAFSHVRSFPYWRPAVGLAAAALVLALGWWLRPNQPAPPAPAPPTPAKSAPDPLLACLVRRDVRLARAETARERLEILADLADDLRGETQPLAQAAAREELAELATLYEQVVRDGIVRQAQGLAAADRRLLLAAIANRLTGAERAVGRLVQKVPPEYARPLRVIVAAAREGSLRLLALQEERS
jgi:hypothetical protein